MSSKRASKADTQQHDESCWFTSVARIRIVKVPTSLDSDLGGLDLAQFELGKIYDVGPRLGELLVVGGYAEPERRERDRAADRSSRQK